MCLEITDRLQGFSSSLLSQHRSRLRNTTSSSYFNQGEEPRGITKAPPFRLNSQLSFHRFISFPQAGRFARCPSSRGAGEVGLCEANSGRSTAPSLHVAPLAPRRRKSPLPACCGRLHLHDLDAPAQKAAASRTLVWKKAMRLLGSQRSSPCSSSERPERT